MKVLFSQIGPKIKKFSVGAQLADFDIFKSTWISPCVKELELTHQTFEGSLSLQMKEGNQIEVMLDYKMNPKVECVRCLTKNSLEISSRFEAHFLKIGGELGETAGVGDERDLSELSNYEVSENGVLPLEEFILDAINDSLPERHLCKPLCLGLCSGCGANKNVEICKCESNVSTSTPFH